MGGRVTTEPVKLTDGFRVPTLEKFACILCFLEDFSFNDTFNHTILYLLNTSYFEMTFQKLSVYNFS